MSYEEAAAAADFIRTKFAGEVRTAIVLGSGLGAFANAIADPVRVPFLDIPGFVRSTVEGHAGQLVFGEIAGKTVVIQQGRFHFYEGYDMDQVPLPVRMYGVLGIPNLILTNAAGSLNAEMQP